MELGFETLGLGQVLAAMAVTVFAGVVKGAIGFAMPLLMISGLAMFLPPDVALAGLILPTLVTNVWQALRQGWRPAVQTAREYRRYLTGTLVFIVIAAQIFDLIPRMAYLLILGVPVTLFAAAQLLGARLALPSAHRTRAEWGLGVVSGIYGGISGIWGPPLQIYLLSIDAPKAVSVRVQGVIYSLGSVTLLLAHLGSGLLEDDRLKLSLLLVPVALGAMAFGNRVQDRIDQVVFRRWTQLLMVVSGLNLIRQAIWGG